MMSVKLFRAALLLHTAFYILRFTYCVLGTALLSFTHCTTFMYVVMFYARRYGFYVLRYGAQTQSHNAITLHSGKYLPGKVLFYCH